jgi:zona occludens toxin (predicted ATPase)
VDPSTDMRKAVPGSIETGGAVWDKLIPSICTRSTRLLTCHCFCYL